MNRELNTIAKKIYSISLDGSYLDSMHQEFISRLDELFAKRPRDEKELTLKIYEYLYYLIFYAKSHFKEEEAFMQNINYPHFVEHVEFHREYLEHINRLDEKIKHDGATKELLDELEDFALGWSIAHINCEDRKIAEYLQRLVSEAQAA